MMGLSRFSCFGVLSFYMVCAVILALSAGCSLGTTKVDKQGEFASSDPSPGGRPLVDSGPQFELNVDHIPDAWPVIEPQLAWANKSPYRVFDQVYHVLKSSDNFSQQGVASWYGNKFNGQRTSNGEIYNMYAMTAAHKTLPLPTFLEVTNLANGRRVIVRVNDRGPFHGDRIIDLSYTAARKLGFSHLGTAPVRIKAIKPTHRQFKGMADPQKRGPLDAPMPRNAGGYDIPPDTYIQVAAFTDRARLAAYQQAHAKTIGYPLRVQSPPDQSVFRVVIGPFPDNWALSHAYASVLKKGYNDAQVVTRKSTVE